MTEPRYAFIGGGNMGRALIGGLIEAGHPREAIAVAETHAPNAERCVNEFGVSVSDDHATVCAAADVVVLAVKPQQMREMATALAQHADDDCLYLSVAAGITTDHLSSWLGQSRSIVRCMPNTPALIGHGAAALYANRAVSLAQRELADRLLGAVGRAYWLEDEAMMDAVTALSGSGPAYFFLFIELLEKIAVELSLPPQLARQLALQTAYGASRLALGSDQSPATLRAEVTSPAGTTERALAEFSTHDLEGIMRQALTAARDRSIELAREIEK